MQAILEKLLAHAFIIAKVIVVTLVIALIFLLASCGSVSTVNVPDPESSDLAPDLLVLVNNVRTSGYTCGSKGSFSATKPLTFNTQLSMAAQKHSIDMDTANEMTHVTPRNAIHYTAGTKLANRVSQEGYSYSTVGENVARGQTSVQAVMNAWLDSDGHCANMMNPTFTEFGAGMSGYFWTQVFGSPL